MTLRSSKRFTLLGCQHERRSPSTDPALGIIHEWVLKEKPLGNDLLSREVALQVPSALTSLTAGFGMGPGVPSPLKSPRDFVYEFVGRHSHAGDC